MIQKILQTIYIFILLLLFLSEHSSAQSGFSTERYRSFLNTTENLTSEEALNRHALKNTYYSDMNAASTSSVAYLDSVIIKFGLTHDEIELLEKNNFVVTERVNSLFAPMFHTIYGYDLPVFVSTDAILQALHASYDRILMGLEADILEPNLEEFLEAMYSSYPMLLEKYKSEEQLNQALEDVDLYVTMAKSLLADTKLSPRYVSQITFDTVWDAVQSEQMVEMPLFSEHGRKLDFSQFTVRGHYAVSEPGYHLGPYFKTMMWLGRMDFLLTAPPDFGGSSWDDDLRRMSLGTVLLNELVDLSGKRALLNENDRIVTFMVGESDNLTPTELDDILESLGISGADDLLDESTYGKFTKTVEESVNAGQRILSNFFIMDPFSAEPDKLPVSFRLMGQRFIIDSYIFSNVVYDRIIYEERKIWRPMPDPLDAMFVLGNDDALQLLKKELDTYKYSSQLTSLRYLVDAYDNSFWEQSLYNTWLEAIRRLNPPVDRNGFPDFMLTAAWQQEKLNTQLASWAQLRHDTLLYAKQSYTGGSLCSFPHSFVEPYPAFYRQIGHFGELAYDYFSNFPSGNTRLKSISGYFSRLHDIMVTLEGIAGKELAGQQFSAEETSFLQTMLFRESGSGAPPFSGWYADLFYITDDALKNDLTIADVHTQPTDEFGGIVGRVLHVGTGKVNLGVFIAESPSNGFIPTAFVGPVMSYYETITDQFDRLTDERWIKMIATGSQPDRPDWVNSYCADSNGNVREKGRELPSVRFSETSVEKNIEPESFVLFRNYPNPFNPVTTVSYSVPESGRITVTVYDILGRKVETLVDAEQRTGQYSVQWNAGNISSGLYFCRIQAGTFERTIKMLLMR
ncbi:DUF3160 domain-containing protein [bacterium]|nr:DUF3160 domain-containing protein [bacterium]